jgi:uncharacterized protein (TIGR02757 family)
VPPPPLSAARARALRRDLEALLARTDAAARVAHDPVGYAHRYADPGDQEIAALFAGFLAFGKVDLFRRTLDPWFAWLDAHGGPRAATRAIDDLDVGPIRALRYRWVDGDDLVALMRGVGAALRDVDRIEALFAGDGDVRARMASAADRLLRGCGRDDPGRALRHLVATPANGSACKRWNLYLRWMVRPADGVDLGVWSALRPADLVMPVDTHVLRTARFLGLTERADASWRTALEVTAALAVLDPDDPVRYDFAIAQMGISGACRGFRDAEVCGSCPLDRLCAAP